MTKKLSLLEQARIEGKKRSLTEIKKELQNRELTHSEKIQILLPNFDMSNHDGTPITYNGVTYQDGCTRAWFDAPQTHKGIKGGVRSGKTFPLCVVAIYCSYINRPSYHFSLSPSFDNACETVVEVLKRLCGENDLSNLWLPSKNLFMIHWGKSEKDIARILIHGQDSNYLGVTAASGDLNEPFAISKRAFDDWWDRISDPRAKLMWRTWGGTAIPELMDWGFEYYDKIKFDEPDFYADTFITYGNKYLSKDYIDGQEKHYTIKEREVRLLGKCIRLAKGQAAYDPFAREKNVDEKMDYELPAGTELSISFDFNVNPMSCLLGAIYKNKMRMLKNFQIENSNTREMCELVINWMSENKWLDLEHGMTKFGRSLIVTGDSTGENRSTKSVESDYAIILDVFENKYNIGIQIALNCSVDKEGKKHYSNPPIRDTLNKVNGMLEVESLIINGVCENLIKALEMTPWKEGAMGFTIDENKYPFSHLSPCLRYMIWNLRALITEEASEGRGVIRTVPREQR